MPGHEQQGRGEVERRADAVGAEDPWRRERTIESARGLPNRAFTSEAFTATERRQLFPRTWMFVAPASDVPEPGDIRPIDAAGAPLLLVRREDGEIRVFHNVCPHRGARLVSDAESGKSALTCPYHAWSFALDGRLRGRPHFHGPGKHDREQGGGRDSPGLFEARSAVWHDWVFVNLDGKAPELAQYLAPVMSRYASYDLSRFRRAHYQPFEFACNWKLAFENYCDMYHVFKVHPGLSKSQDAASRRPMTIDGLHLFNGYTFAEHRRGLLDDADGPVLPALPALPDDLRSRMVFCGLFPNAGMSMYPNNLQFVLFEPVGVERTVMHMWFYFVGEAASAETFRSARDKVCNGWVALNAEDENVCRRLQEGRGNDAYDGGRLAPYWDAGTLHFHRQIADAIRGEGAFALEGATASIQDMLQPRSGP